MSSLVESLHRAKQGRFLDVFYEDFLAADPRVRQLFRNTDWEQQQKLLLHSLHMMIEYGRGNPVGTMAMRRLAESHGPKGLAIPHDLYPIWRECVIRALRKTDPQLVPAVERKWRSTLTAGIEVMTGAEVVTAGEAHRRPSPGRSEP